MRKFVTPFKYPRIFPLFLGLSYFIFSASSCNKEISVTPPDAPPPNGYIHITSNPEGFHIYINHIEKRRATPDSITWLSTGNYLITLKKDLFRDSSFTFYAVEGTKPSVYIDYTKNPAMRGNINCTSIPTNAEIFIGDSSTGLHTPSVINAMPGNYYIKYRAKNCRDDSIIATISSGKTSSAKFALVDTTLWRDFTTSNSGIPSNNLSSVAVDQNDIVWVGSYTNGYFNFNGSKWTSFYNSLSTAINCIAADVGNIKYIGTIRGLIVIYSDASTVEYGFTTSALPDLHIYALAVDNNGICYIGTKKSITQFPGWADFSPNNGEEPISLPITSLALDKTNNIWAVLNDTMIVKSISKYNWIFYTTSTPGIFSSNITALTVSPSGDVWTGFNNGKVFGNGLSYFDGSVWNKVNPIPSTSRTNTIFIDKNDNKWVGTNQGLFMFNSPSNVTTFNHDNTGLNLTNITDITQDTFGNTWIATNAGLFEYKGKR
jgi:ligand-binding sensor domain-containing protein